MLRGAKMDIVAEPAPLLSASRAKWCCLLHVFEGVIMAEWIF